MLTATPTLSETAERLLGEAHAAKSGRAALTLVGGSGHVLRQTVIALQRGEELAEHASPGEATLLVLLGSVELRAGEVVHVGSAGELLAIPPCPHSLLAAEDAAVLLTVARRP